MGKTLKGKVDFEINLQDDKYEFDYERLSVNELASLMVVREILKFSKDNLKESLKQASGKHLELVKDRLGKVTTSEYTISMMIESVIGEFMFDEIPETDQKIASIQQPLVEKIH